MNCRGCGDELSLILLDLGLSPIANNLIDTNLEAEVVQKHALKVMTCENCALVQLSEVISKGTLFPKNYLYYSSYSTSWLAHCKKYVQEIITFLDLTKDDFVIELASNDGYLLQFFMELGIEILGIEPAEGVAAVAKSKNIPTLIDFFGRDIANRLEKKRKPRLIIGNNVLAHVPDLHDFIAGLEILLDDEGIITLEFPHIVNLIRLNQFDTIYHEHFSYLSLSALNPIFIKYNLKVFKVEKLETHGGSIRIYLAKLLSKWEITQSVEKIFEEEIHFDPRRPDVYKDLQEKVLQVKSSLISELQTLKNNGYKIAAYGAAAKGVTLLNYCGINSNIVDYVVDRNPHKHGMLLPGSYIQVVGVEKLTQEVPDVVLVLPWNLSSEIKHYFKSELRVNPRLLRAIPSVEYF